MAYYLSYAGLLGFVVVFGWCFATDQPLGHCLVHGLVAAFLCALITRWWMRLVFVELHHSLYLKQTTEQQVQSEANQAAADTAAADAAAEADAAVAAMGGAAMIAAQDAGVEEEAPAGAA